MDIKKEQLNKAELALWKIFNIVSDMTLSRKNKKLSEIRQIISDYLNEKIQIKENKQNERKDIRN